MESATQSNPLHDMDYLGDQQDERFLLLPLSPSLELDMVKVIESTLMKLPDVGPTLGATRRKLTSFLNSYSRAGAQYLVLFDRYKERVVGGVGVLPFAGLDQSERIGEIRELVVDSPYRGRGLGLKLLRAAFQSALRLNYSRLYLETTEQMEHAQALFIRCGFRPVSIKGSKKKNVTILTPAAPAYYVWEEGALGPLDSSEARPGSGVEGRDIELKGL